MCFVSNRVKYENFTWRDLNKHVLKVSVVMKLESKEIISINFS